MINASSPFLSPSMPTPVVSHSSTDETVYFQYLLGRYHIATKHLSKDLGRASETPLALINNLKENAEFSRIVERERSEGKIPTL
jgi:hypothetical protein